MLFWVLLAGGQKKVVNKWFGYGLFTTFVRPGTYFWNACIIAGIKVFEGAKKCDYGAFLGDFVRRQCKFGGLGVR